MADLSRWLTPDGSRQAGGGARADTATARRLKKVSVGTRFIVSNPIALLQACSNPLVLIGQSHDDMVIFFEARILPNSAGVWPNH